MLNQLLQLAMQKRKYDPKLLEAAFESIFGAALRSGEWKTLRVGAYDQAKHTLHVVVCKAANAKNGLPTEMDLPILTELTHRSLSLLQNHRRARGARDDELLIPRNILAYEDACAYIKEAAKAFQWPDPLTFDGPHTLRHGGVQCMKKLCDDNEAMRQQLLEAAQMSPGTMEHYCESNTFRVSKATKRE